MSYADDLIGKLLTELDRLDLRKNTIVALIGDHGWSLGEHKLFCKYSNFQTATNAPMIISGIEFEFNLIFLLIVNRFFIFQNSSQRPRKPVTGGN